MWFTSVLMSMFFSTPRYEIQLSRRQLFPCSNVWLHVRPSIPPSVWIICCRLLFNNLSIIFVVYVYANINYDNAFLAFPHSFEKAEEIQTFVWTDRRTDGQMKNYNWNLQIVSSRDTSFSSICLLTSDVCLYDLFGWYNRINLWIVFSFYNKKVGSFKGWEDVLMIDILRLC